MKLSIFLAYLWLFILHIHTERQCPVIKVSSLSTNGDILQMPLFVYAQFCILFTASCVVLPLPAQLLSGDFAPEDIQRAVKAENYLLSGAELLQYVSPHMTLYRKRGSLETAARDFHLLNELQVLKGASGIDMATVIGRTGNRELTLHAGIGEYPQISLTRFELGSENTFHRYTKMFWYYGKSKTANNEK